MCMTEEMPRNSESQMLSQLVKWIQRNIPELKVLFTWADGMVGKVGYVYQASNFIYAGWTEGQPLLEKGYKGVFESLPEEKQSILIGRRADLAERAGIDL